MNPDEEFTDAMKERARELCAAYERRVEMIWDETVVEPLELEFNLNTEAAEILAADHGV